MNHGTSKILAGGICLLLLTLISPNKGNDTVAGSADEGLIDGGVSTTIEATTLRDSTAPSQEGSSWSCLPHYGDRQFILQVNETTDHYEAFPTAADLNSDGLEDIVIRRSKFETYDTYELDILLNDGNGGMALATSAVFSGTVPAVQNPTEVIVADFNGDDRPDIFVADHGYDPHPHPGYQNVLVLSTPDGKLVDATYNLPQQDDFTHSACAADIDSDGDIDLYVGNIWGQNNHYPQILLNDGSGEFSAGESRLPPLTDLDQNGYTTCAFIDVNNDDSPDLVLGDAGDEITNEHSTATSEVLLNDGSGVFTLLPNAMPAKPFAVTDIGLGIQPVDLNADGYQDLLIAYTKGDPSYVGRYVQVLINNQDGTFRDETGTRLPQSDNNDPYFHRLYLRDLDRDQDMDLIAKQEEWRDPDPLVFLNDGAGHLSQHPLHFGVGWLNYAFLDFDGDGGHDLVVASYAPPEEIYAIRDLGCPVFLPFICRN